MSDNKSLIRAGINRNDEFYTRLCDIESELGHYDMCFAGKKVLCNCDDPVKSRFFQYFCLNFERLGLKELTAVCLGSPSRMAVVTQKPQPGAPVQWTQPEWDGDFRSPEGVQLLKKSDVVVTNPPFSLLKEYISLIIRYQKRFVIIGNRNAVTYKEIFPLIRDNRMWLGYGFKNGSAYFHVPEDKGYSTGVYNAQTGLVRFRNCCWFTNLDLPKRHAQLVLKKRYSRDKYPFYDNYDAINVPRLSDIPFDYHGVMGVPITFFDVYSPEQFEILGLAASAKYDAGIVGIPFRGQKDARPLVNGRNTYARVFVRLK